MGYALSGIYPIMGTRLETSYTPSIYTGDGAGRFSLSSTSPSIPFIKDIIQPRVLIRGSPNGGPIYSPSVWTNSHNNQRLHIADFTGDGKDDILYLGNDPSPQANHYTARLYVADASTTGFTQAPIVE